MGWWGQGHQCSQGQREITSVVVAGLRASPAAEDQCIGPFGPG